MLKADLPTPALWLDLDIFESNLAFLAKHFRNAKVAWRPQTKALRWAGLIRRVLETGAAGVTCANLEHAEQLASEGIDDILLAKPVAGTEQVRRVVELSKRCTLTLVLDSAETARSIDATARTAGARIKVLIEIDLGLRRCGVPPGEATLVLAKEVAALDHVEFRGVMAWEGHVISMEDPDAKKAACIAAVEKLVATAAACREAGLACPVVNCGGSATLHITPFVPGVTEIEAGGAVIGDLQYLRWGTQLPPALHLTATVISAVDPTRAVVDMGYKKGGGTTNLPQPKDRPGVTMNALHAEHGLLRIEPHATPLRVGDRIDFVAGYSDQTTYLHRRLFGVRREVVECVWD